MRISIAEAEGRLGELMRRAADGEEVVLIQEQGPAIRFAPVPGHRPPMSPKEKRALIERLQDEVRRKNLPPDADAAHSQDFLYDEFGLPK